MKFLEKDLEEIIWEAAKNNADALSDRNLHISGILYRQLKIGNYGRADLVEIIRPRFNPYSQCFERGLITVYELKQGKVSVSSFFQAIRYLRGIQRYIEKYYEDQLEMFDFGMRLIGSEFDRESDICFLPEIIHGSNDMLDNYNFKVEIYLYNYRLDGIHFDDVSGYLLTNEGF